MNPPLPYLVVDLEATCDEPKSFPRSETEIIEIGAVLVDAATLEVEDEFQTFVRPRRHPRLTAFCTQLTTITQDQVDDAPGFPRAIAALTDFLGCAEVTMCSWGAYDWNQFRRDATWHRVTLPFQRHINLKERFSRRHPSGRRFGVRGALRQVGLGFHGTPHRGIDDARNIARLLPWVMDGDPRAIPPEPGRRERGRRDRERGSRDRGSRRRRRAR